MQLELAGDPLLSTIVGGRFRVEERVGAGTMGPLYRTYDERTGGRAALKVFSPAWSADLSAARRIQRDATRVGSLQNPTVVEVLDVGRVGDGRPYIASDWVHGLDLDTALAAGARLMASEVASLLAPLAAALDEVHASGVVHRVIKPTKILLNRSTQGPAVRLQGFGIGALLTPDASAARPTRDVSAYGAAPYLAPEADGVRVDHRADVYSLGVIAFQLIAGRRPFDSDESLLLMVAKKTKRAPTLREVSGVEHTELVESVIARVLATSPADRYQTASGFVEDLLRASLGKAPHGVQRSGLPAEDDAGPPDFTDPAEIVSDLLAVATHAAMTGHHGSGKAHRGPIATPVALSRLPSLAFRTSPPPANESSSPSEPSEPLTVTEPPEPIGPRDTQPMSALAGPSLRAVAPPADLHALVEDPAATDPPAPPAPAPEPEPRPARDDDTVPVRPGGRAARVAVPLDVGAFERAVEEQRAAEERKRSGAKTPRTGQPPPTSGAPSPAVRMALLVAGTLLAILAVALIIRLVVRPLLLASS